MGDRIFERPDGRLCRGVLIHHIPKGFIDITEKIKVLPEHQDVEFGLLENKNGVTALRKGAKQKLRKKKIEKIRKLRKSLLAEADILINKAADLGRDTKELRAYRQSLRSLTEQFKTKSGEWSSKVDSIELETFEFPKKP